MNEEQATTDEVAEKQARLRKQLSARTRFEILKRDGFKCRYCGATSISAVLHVDHVVAVSRGGTDAPENLATACINCNLGKSNVALDELRFKGPTPADEAMEHAAQIREYLMAQQAVEHEKEGVVDWLADYWRHNVGEDPMESTMRSMRVQIERYSLDQLCDAIRSTGKKARTGSFRRYDDPVRYFHGCLRKIREASE